MHAPDETDLLLDLLREAGDEPVTLDELHVAGVRDPAQAVLALEVAGHAVSRVHDSSSRPGRSVTCVRLGAPEPEPSAAMPAPAPPARAGVDQRLLVGALLGALVLFLLARRD